MRILVRLKMPRLQMAKCSAWDVRTVPQQQVPQRVRQQALKHSVQQQVVPNEALQLAGSSVSAVTQYGSCS